MAISRINGPGERYTPDGDMDLPEKRDNRYFDLIDMPRSQRLHVAETVRSIAELLPRRLHISRDTPYAETLIITPEIKRHVEMVLTGCMLAGMYSRWDTDFIVPAAQHSVQDHDWSNIWTVILYVVRLAPMEELEQARLIGSIQATQTVMNTALYEAQRRLKWAEECPPDTFGSGGFAFEPFRYIDITDDASLARRLPASSLDIGSFPHQTAIRDD